MKSFKTKLKTKKKIFIMKYVRLILSIKLASYLVEYFYKVSQSKNGKIADQVNDSLIELRSSVKSYILCI